MKQNRTAIILMLTGLMAAVAAAAVVFFLTANIERKDTTTQVTAQPTVQTRPVIVAATDIAAATLITPSMVFTREESINLIPLDAIASIDEAVNKTAGVPIFSGQIVLTKQLGDAGGIVGLTIPKGKVLVAFPATDMLNSTGAVKQGDRVDILLSIPISGTTRLDAGADVGSQVGSEGKTLVTQGTLQNVQVASVGYWTPPGQQTNQQNAQQQQNAALKVISFMVDRQEALILKYVKDSGGTIDLAVRSKDDTDETVTDPVTIDYLVDLYGFIGLQQTQPPAPAPAP